MYTLISFERDDSTLSLLEFKAGIRAYVLRIKRTTLFGLIKQPVKVIATIHIDTETGYNVYWQSLINKKFYSIKKLGINYGK